MQQRILIVEDEPDMQFLLTDALEGEGYDVVATASGVDAAERVTGDSVVDLVLLDIMLPDLDGFEVCRRIRRTNPHVQIIMLTAKGGEIDRVVGLEIGADDYVTKPFSMRELVARIKAALRRTTPVASDALARCSIGRREVDFLRREVRAGAACEKLTRYESDLLQYLAARRGVVVSREGVLKDVWGVLDAEPNANNRTVDNYVARLRTKIEDTPSSPQHLLTVHGKGYKLA